ncbi:MAG: TRAP transporter small permease subunit [Methylacidiphilales bacterium]|nr:TRAP transporter small permease subunit [Candidatus Methylacidiphilales bacterium]
MNLALKITRVIDRCTDFAGWVAVICLIGACLICSGNAIVRYSLNLSSNAFLEIQWYLFAGVVMFGAPQVFRLGEHIRVDILYSKYSERTQVLIDCFGIVFFLLPTMTLFFYLSFGIFINKLVSGEMSPNAGGLLRFPVWSTLPIGFALVSLQGFSELIKRLVFLRTGQCDFFQNVRNVQ